MRSFLRFRFVVILGVFGITGIALAVLFANQSTFESSNSNSTPANNIQDTQESVAENASTNVPHATPVEPVQSSALVALPVDGYETHRTFKAFGEYIQDRFVGYHVGDDVEIDDVNVEVPVYAVADGAVVYAQTVSGYGGVLILECTFEANRYRVLYGHIDIGSLRVQVGTRVQKGDTLAVLGADRSAETDGERKHLHFSVYHGSDIRFAGYTGTEDGLDQWMNPQNFFSAYGVDLQPTRSYDPETDLGGDIFRIAFMIPEGMEVEYIPQLEALNVFTLGGPGSARERSQLLIRYFDADQFLTLSTVDVLEARDTTVGDGYVAKQYRIQKKESVAPFAYQPAWRNSEHTVTDFRGSDGQTRYYVVAANPSLSQALYEQVRASMRIVEER